MSVVAKPLPFGFVPPPFPKPQVELIDEDGIPVENEWHRLAMGVLINSIRYHFRQRRDYWCGGNAFIYFSEQQARNRDFRGPDFYFVWGRPQNPPRRYWAIWEEDWRFPNVIVELLSPSTRDDDLGIKKDVYQDIFKTPDYFCYDPESKELMGWTLTAGEYVALEPNEHGRLWCEQLGLWIGPARGTVEILSAAWPRFFTPEGRIVPTSAEATAEENKRVKQEVKRANENVKRVEEKNKCVEERAELANEEAKRAKEEAKRAKEDVKRIEEEAKRAKEDVKRVEEEAGRANEKFDKAQAEIARLKALLQERDPRAS